MSSLSKNVSKHIYYMFLNLIHSLMTRAFSKISKKKKKKIKKKISKKKKKKFKRNMFLGKIWQ